MVHRRTFFTSFAAQAAFVNGSRHALVPPVRRVTQQQWNELNTTVAGRLASSVPLASSCYTSPDSSECAAIEAGYTTNTFRSEYFGAYMNTEWETCQATGQSCLLDWSQPNSTTTLIPENCHLGSIPNYYIDVHEASDVSAAFVFAKRTKIPLTIKNTGHDYSGRSSAPNSLAVWTHHLKDMSYTSDFVPEGCDGPGQPAMTIGAGAQFVDVYDFADAHNVTFVGGSDKTVGASGGWLQGGGHGMLANTLGLGVDRVLQFKIVTPDGQLRVANACQNEDLFWALRGGGGGTFGVVMESTSMVAPKLTIQAFYVQFNATATTTHDFLEMIINNSERWVKEGWSGTIGKDNAIYLNPKLSHQEAVTSMKPFTDFGTNLGTATQQNLALEIPSWKTIFTMIAASPARVGRSLALSSRLIPVTNFQTPESRQDLLSALETAISTVDDIRILANTPFNYVSDGKTSVTPAWRNSVWHLVNVKWWNSDTDISGRKASYDALSHAANLFRALTPNSGAYQNEADVHEPNPEASFWGSNYGRLLNIKRKYDPHGLLDCWNCIGFKGPNNSRFSCYI